MPRLVYRKDKVERRILLCLHPKHIDEFYYPLASGEKAGCPYDVSHPVAVYACPEVLSHPDAFPKKQNPTEDT